MIVSDIRDQKNANAGIVAFGFFDSIHIGHQAVIGRAVELAREYGVPASVFLFKNNIFPLIGIDKRPFYTFSERLELIERLGVDRVFFVEADLAFLSMSSEEFLDYLSERLAIVGFTCGNDFSFGKGALGTPCDLLARFGPISDILSKWSIQEWWAPKEDLDDSCEEVSTDLVKRCLADGNLRKAYECLGRHFSVKQTVRSGRQDGAKIGFPTINFDLGDLPLKRGVYFTNVVLNGARLPAVTNVGGHPTFADETENIETYILDFYGDLYDREVEVEFLTYHREIRSFASERELTLTIESDVQAREDYRHD